MKNGFEHTDEAIKNRGEVFTPSTLVNQMLDKLPPELFTDKSKTFLDNSCGNGQFLISVLKRKLANGINKRDALKSIYGVEIDPHNTKECQERLLDGSESEELRDIVEHNIICADSLNPDHPGWKNVGYFWSGKKKIDLTDFFLPPKKVHGDKKKKKYDKIKKFNISVTRNPTCFSGWDELSPFHTIDF